MTDDVVSSQVTKPRVYERDTSWGRRSGGFFSCQSCRYHLGNVENGEYRDVNK